MFLSILSGVKEFFRGHKVPKLTAIQILLPDHGLQHAFEYAQKLDSPRKVYDRLAMHVLNEQQPSVESFDTLASFISYLSPAVREDFVAILIRSGFASSAQIANEHVDGIIRGTGVFLKLEEVYALATNTFRLHQKDRNQERALELFLRSVHAEYPQQMDAFAELLTHAFGRPILACAPHAIQPEVDDTLQIIANQQQA